MPKKELADNIGTSNDPQKQTSKVDEDIESLLKSIIKNNATNTIKHEDVEELMKESDDEFNNDDSQCNLEEAEDTDTISKSHEKQILKKSKYFGDRKAVKQQQKMSSCKCDGCSREDCNQCRYCIDRPKNGGQGKRRRRCVERQCINSACPIPECHARYNHPYELKIHVASTHFRSSLEKKIEIKVNEKCKIDDKCKFTCKGHIENYFYHYGFAHMLLKDIDADVSLISHLL